MSRFVFTSGTKGDSSSISIVNIPELYSSLSMFTIDVSDETKVNLFPYGRTEKL
jgi:hypothetical protein